jgi:hypothetical protein
MGLNGAGALGGFDNMSYYSHQLEANSMNLRTSSNLNTTVDLMR